MYPAAQPEIQIYKNGDEPIASDARLIIATSKEMKAGIRQSARRHPGVHFVLFGGDDAVTGTAPKNLSHLMGRMTDGQMMAGFATVATVR